MKKTLQLLLISGVVVSLCASAQAETKEERKARIERKYLHQKVTAEELDILTPTDLEAEDSLERNEDAPDEEWQESTPLVRRGSPRRPVRRASSALLDDESDLEDSESQLVAERRREKLQDSWDRLQAQQRALAEESSDYSSYYSTYGSSSSAGSSGYTYGSSSTGSGYSPSSYTSSGYTYGSTSSGSYTYGSSSSGSSSTGYSSLYSSGSQSGYGSSAYSSPLPSSYSSAGSSSSSSTAYSSTPAAYEWGSAGSSSSFGSAQTTPPSYRSTTPSTPTTPFRQNGSSFWNSGDDAFMKLNND